MTEVIIVRGSLSGRKYVVKLKDKGYRYKARVYVLRDKPLFGLLMLKCVEKSYPKVREYDKHTRAHHLVDGYERSMFRNK